MSFEVRLRDPDGQLESVSDLQLLNGRNAALVVDADGGAELIQFRDVTPLGNDIYRLSTLLRGRRGTEARLAHAPGAVIVVLDDEGALFTEPLGLIGQPCAIAASAGARRSTRRTRSRRPCAAPISSPTPRRM